MLKKKKAVLTPRQQRMAAVAGKRQEGVVVLEDVHDPHNAAAVMRTCEGLGLSKIVLIFEKQKAWNPRRVGRVSSSSANKWLEFEIFRSTETALKTLKKRGYRIYATTLGEGATSLEKVTFKSPKTAIIFGNEHLGVSETAAKLSHELIYLPMQGFVQSYNISVTAAMFLYEQFRQRYAAGTKKFLLKPLEQKALLKSWSKR